MNFACGLAAETLVETPEGPMEIRKVAGKEIPVLTRDATGRVRFRLMRDVQLVATAPVLRLRLDNGSALRAVPAQRLFLANLDCVALQELRPGAVLCAAFHYPAGYRYLADAAEERVSAAGWVVEAVEPAGEAEVFSLRVVPEQCFFASAGILLQSA